MGKHDLWGRNVCVEVNLWCYQSTVFRQLLSAEQEVLVVAVRNQRLRQLSEVELQQ